MPVPVLIVVGTPSEGLSPPAPLEVAAAGAAGRGPHPHIIADRRVLQTRLLFQPLFLKAQVKTARGCSYWSGHARRVNNQRTIRPAIWFSVFQPKF